MARPSRPPGFDMTYRPAETVFGPPFVVFLPSIVYAALALGAVVVVLVAEQAAPGSFLYREVVLRGAHGFIGARTFAALLVAGAVASIIRAGMRGVRIRGDGIEFRDVVALGVPRLRRFKWAQIDRIVLDGPRCIALELWDGNRADLPEVGDRPRLAAALEMVGHARAIPVRGGVGLDELPEEELGEEQA
ncbi:MAG TPA: hypothetical protein VFZ53_23260 [Polyangiaceae bacterium]